MAKTKPVAETKRSTPIILGIDEVGRGPWAGPLVVGAVVLGERFSEQQLSYQNEELQNFWHDLTDSKKLTAKKRLALAKTIETEAAATGLGWVSAAELDQRGLSSSLRLATRRAVKQILAAKAPFTEIIIDGISNFLSHTPLESKVTILKKADLLIKEVSAASIIAKVARDNYMKDLAIRYPAYGFESHVGYGTAAHKTAIETYGICSEHRRSFKPIKAFIGQNEITQYSTIKPVSVQNSTERGRQAETLVAKYLQDQGHQILTQNFKTKAYEIDLISIAKDCIYFTEVKYRQNSDFGSSLEQITPSKLRQMQFAAQAFLATHPEISLKPVLAGAAVEGTPPQIQAWISLEA